MSLTINVFRAFSAEESLGANSPGALPQAVIFRAFGAGELVGRTTSFHQRPLPLVVKSNFAILKLQEHS